MILFYELRHELAKKTWNEQFYKSIANGKFKKFDEAFYRQFDGMYYDALPLYYYLRIENMEKCYRTSAILALALDQADIHICRGDLKKQAIIENKKHFGHGWLEIGNTVYDTTWQIIADKDTYYKVFGVVTEENTGKKQYFSNPIRTGRGIHNRAFFEQDITDYDFTIVEETKQKVKTEMNYLDPTSQKYLLRQKLLNDLPIINMNRNNSIMTHTLSDISN